MNQYQSYIHRSRYARWLPDEGRRETWDETVNRYVQFWKEKDLISSEEAGELFQGIHSMEVMPSMRALATAGPALDRDAMAGYNCSYVAIDNVRAFDEIVYILMNGTGVGFSVERQFVSQLPIIPEEFTDTYHTITVQDSKIGWASAYRELLYNLYNGRIPIRDVSLLRPKGAPLKTFGGRSSGPAPLVALFGYTVEKFKSAKGRRLTSLECHDLVCKIAEIVVVGGVRRSALISLSNLSDDRMRDAKSGQWYLIEGQRALSNNSAVYSDRPDFDVFMKEWVALHSSKSGERGLFSRMASKDQAAKSGRRDVDHEFGTNPCSEIILRSNQVCNLSEVVVRSTDNLDKLRRKVRLATILGTLQSTLTNFRYVRPIWQENTEEERLLGVSLTGIMDHPLLSDASNPTRLSGALKEFKEIAIYTNKVWADRLGIPQSTAITCVKPSGTVSQLVDSASGIHARFSPYYVRRVRQDKKDPITQLLIDQGVPHEQDVMNEENMVFSFPQRAPEGSVVTNDMTAMKQLELNEIYEQHWAEHKISQTVFYSDDEFLKVGQWAWDNLETSSGVSFLPRNDHVYKQAPYEEITSAEYYGQILDMPEINWELLSNYENEDLTEVAQTLACTGNMCEI